MTLTLQTPPKIYVNWDCDIICPIFEPLDQECKIIFGMNYGTVGNMSRLKHLTINHIDLRNIKSRILRMSLVTLTLYCEINMGNLIDDFDGFWIEVDDIGSYTGMQFVDPQRYLQPLLDPAETDDLESFFAEELNECGGIADGMTKKREMIEYLARMKNRRPSEDTWTPPEVRFMVLKVFNDGDSRPFRFIAECDEVW
jgi:hypothetical protein